MVEDDHTEISEVVEVDEDVDVPEGIEERLRREKGKPRDADLELEE